MNDLTGRSLLAVFAHPDDESIACGGLLARCADGGARVTVICATHGENHCGVRDMDLYARRPQELERAAHVLGVAEVVQYDYADGFLPWIDPTEFAARLHADITRLRPDVVITFGRDGLYWHPDHIALYQVTTAVVEQIGADGPALFYVTMPPGLMREVVNAYMDVAPEEGGHTQLLGMANPDAYGVSCDAPTLIVDIRSCAHRKLAALKCHETQVRDGALARIRESEAPQVFRVEHFHRAAVGSMRPSFIEQI